MKIGILGNGYIGTTIAAILAEIGHDVIGYEICKDKFDKLSSGISPIYEDDLEEILKESIDKGKLTFTMKISDLKDNDVNFLAVGTPKNEETGKAELKYILKAAKDLAPYIKENSLVITKSTVPPKTNSMLEKVIRENTNKNFEIVSNPEFLREGSAVHDFYNPDRIVIGTNNKEKINHKIEELYGHFIKKNVPILYTSLESAELIKYASNSFLALSISYINELARVAEKFGADIDDVSLGMKLDKRIGKNAFLKAGLGFGGSCFPKDVSALYELSKELGNDLKTLESTLKINEEQVNFMYDKIKNNVNTEKTIGILGLSFKENSDDIRYSKSIELIKKLQSDGFKVIAYDPKSIEHTQKIIPDIKYTKNPEEVIEKSDAVVLGTPWKEFKDLDYSKTDIVFDGKNFLNKENILASNTKYFGIGK